MSHTPTLDFGRNRKPRTHYVPDCSNESGNDRLAATSSEYGRVNCPDCLDEMISNGVM